MQVEIARLVSTPEQEPTMGVLQHSIINVFRRSVWRWSSDVIPAIAVSWFLEKQWRQDRKRLQPSGVIEIEGGEVFQWAAPKEGEATFNRLRSEGVGIPHEFDKYGNAKRLIPIFDPDAERIVFVRVRAIIIGNNPMVSVTQGSLGHRSSGKRGLAYTAKHLESILAKRLEETKCKVS